ncbi:MAG: hypothetical protein GPJ51_13280 [Candidatus Heimdallarchaeota archaeon]|nr:hypothetical protein [Candidatus Heimdallarchaeota archaeon]
MSKEKQIDDKPKTKKKKKPIDPGYLKIVTDFMIVIFCIIPGILSILSLNGIEVVRGSVFVDYLIIPFIFFTLILVPFRVSLSGGFREILSPIHPHPTDYRNYAGFTPEIVFVFFWYYVIIGLICFVILPIFVIDIFVQIVKL